MLPFLVELKAGAPVYEQVVYAARMAIVTGELRAGDDFPSVRAISKACRINPNTAQKAVNELKRQGLIEILPGIGTRVCACSNDTQAELTDTLRNDLEALALRAKQSGVSLKKLTQALNDQWKKLS